jgi:hypothetical protein
VSEVSEDLSPYTHNANIECILAMVVVLRRLLKVRSAKNTLSTACAYGIIRDLHSVALIETGQRGEPDVSRALSTVLLMVGV